MKIGIKIKLMQAWMYCEDNQKNTAFTIARMVEEVEVTADEALAYINSFKGQGLSAALDDIYSQIADEYANTCHVSMVKTDGGSIIPVRAFLMNYLIAFDRELRVVKQEKHDKAAAKLLKDAQS